MDVRVVITAAGSGIRFGKSLPKQFMPLGGEPVLNHTIRCFTNCDFVNEIAVVLPQEFLKDFYFTKVDYFVAGKKTRAESVYEGLKKISRGSSTDETVVLVHDGVRPFVSVETIKDVAQKALAFGAAIAAAKVTNTIKKADNQGYITETISRENLWMAATPQGFKLSKLLDMFRDAKKLGYLESATDEAYLAEKAGYPVFLVKSNPENIKITNPADLLIAEGILSKGSYE